MNTDKVIRIEVINFKGSHETSVKTIIEMLRDKRDLKKGLTEDVNCYDKTITDSKLYDVPSRGLIFKVHKN
jgi:hypothetical protein